MIRALLFAMVAAMLPQQPQSRDTAPPAGTASISGVVIAADDQRPIVYALVSLNSENRVGDRLTYANAKGEFSFPKLAAGSYRVSSDAPGYLGMSLGQAQPGRAGVLQVIAEGEERKGLNLALHKGGVVSGRVLGPDGRPLSAVRVSALQMSWRTDGVREFSLNSNGATTDDRGDYRIAGLLAGTYVVEVMPTYIESLRSPALDGVQVLATEALVPTFFPGAIDPVGAIPITVEIDHERPGVDFTLAPATLAEVRGRVEGAVQSPDASTRVTLRPANQLTGGVVWDSDIRSRSATARPDGRFLLEAVPPGEYELIAYQSNARLGQVGMGLISVNGRDIADASITMRPTITISGEQFLSGSSAPFPSVFLRPVDGFLSPQNGVLRSQPNGAGRFSIANVPPGRYIVGMAQPAPANWYQSLVEIGGVPLAGSLIEVGTTDIGARITYGSGMAEVSGTIRHEDQSPVSDYSLVIFPPDPKEWPMWMTGATAVGPDSSGRYSKTLKPGSYLIAAVRDVAYNQWLDPEFIKTLVTSATPIKLAEGQKLSQDFIVK